MKRIIAGMFDQRSQADLVVERLVQEYGIDRNAIQVYAADADTTRTTSSMAAEGGFWASMKDLFVTEDDRYTYSEGVRRGGIVVSAEVDEAQTDRAMDIFEEYGAVNLDEREAEWRQAGWTADPTVPASATRAPGMGVEGEEVIPLVEENLRVGKRAEQGGRVRVRSYIVETPVTEEVTLRKENVDVHRRPADRAVTSADDVFRDRTIEATETSEEAVVSKEARVKEELVIRKDVEERVETVHETVRHQEVEIDDTRGTEGARHPDTDPSRKRS